jgi:hypothetical protein
MGRVSLAGMLIALCSAAACAMLQPPGGQPSGKGAPPATSKPAEKATTAPSSAPAATSRPATTQATATAPSPTTTQSSAAGGKPSSGNPEVDDILDRLEVKGEAIKGLGCKLTYKYVTVEPVEDAQIKDGTLLFARAEPNAKFLVHFTKLTADGVTSDRGEYFLFDGQWLVERNDKAKTIIRRQIVRPGERIDPFKVGKGPFPLPFGQKRADILSNFKVTLAPFELGDPRNTWHLHCVPLPNSELAEKYARVEIFVDRTLELPVRIVTERISDRNRIEVDFKDVDVAEAPALSRFQIQQPGEKLDDFTDTMEELPSLTDAPPPGKPAP